MLNHMFPKLGFAYKGFLPVPKLHGELFQASETLGSLDENIPRVHFSTYVQMESDLQKHFVKLLLETLSANPNHYFRTTKQNES